ncbi:MAG: hypothetical protein CVV12_09750 [Gammaproteobacteria bacterium HGW-Gammaproteobacteria-2]|jgi:uncharacterized membrane protein YkvA (DUF1232 family)|nr:MAG: hypothetical protein CVV12_09750 [Gammaproteobacteria bacterium HGW-Gammaproteobacteria-2]
MSLVISIELSDHDLERFRAAQKSAQSGAAKKSTAEVIAAAQTLLADAKKVSIPDFIAARLTRLDDLIAMLSDEAWDLPVEDRQRVLSALVYFADPEDVIPDSVPVLGYLDDAIMIELCVGELQHELQAYDDFCDFRAREARRRNADPSTVGRADWLQDRRTELLERMHSRRERDVGTGYGRSSGYGSSSSSSYNSNSWRPSTFRVF